MSEYSTIQTLSNAGPLSDPIEINPGHDGFFATIQFDAPVAAQINYYFSATKDGPYVQDPQLDDDVTTVGPHAADIATKAKWVRVGITTVAAFSADLKVARG